MNKPELLLPVGNYQMCLAAIHNGANAIYVGMPEFNARGRSHDHSWEELEEIIQISHLYGVQVHLAFNILIFEQELEKAMDVLDRAVLLGPDALIVQDIGMISLIRARYPSLVIHGSTQMTVTNHEAIELLDDLNIKRFVLGRENSLSEIAKIKNKTDKELEVFVHGALCVAYSGQCFTSESLGGRSANRGKCAQSCRFDYEIYVDDVKKDLGINKYLVSPQDLCGIEEVPKLMELGVESFKVEGRLKSPEYVGTIASSYKRVISGEVQNAKSLKEDMAITYSRGFYPGWLNGVAHQELVEGSFKANRGHFIGVIKSISKSEIVLETNAELSKGDGLLFIIKINESVKEIGEKIYDIRTIKGESVIKLGPGIDLSELSIGIQTYITRKEKIIKTIAQSIKNRDLQKRIPLNISISGKIGSPLKCIVTDGENEVEVFSNDLLELASSRPLENKDMIKGLSGLSQTAYKLSVFDNQIKDQIYIHNRELKNLKQSYVSSLNSLRTTPKKHLIKNTLTESNSILSKDIGSKLNVLVRKKEQLIPIVELLNSNDKYREILNCIILDFEFGKDYFSSVKTLKENNIKTFIATTRILKPDEYHNFTLIERCCPDGILVRNLGALNYFKNSNYELIGDFSLNCSNSKTHDYLINKGLISQSASYDLNINQLNDLIQKTDSSKLEITIHQYMPEFHMEHCVFAAFLSKGNSFKDCGKPCEKHEVYLKDMYGNRHELKADQECRNTMFNAKAQSAIKYLEDWQRSGVQFMRFECLHENSNELKGKLETYFQLLGKEITNEMAYSKIGKTEIYGLGTGQLKNTRSYKSRKKIDV